MMLKLLPFSGLILFTFVVNVELRAQDVSTPTPAKSVSKPLGISYGEPGVSEVVSSLVGALVGGIIGIAAGWISANRAHKLTTAQSKETEAAMNDAVRKMLIVEIDQNLVSLRNDAERTHVNARPDDRTGSEWLALQPCPEWSTIVWKETMLIAVRALKPDEAAEVQTLYSSLHSLTSAQNTLTALFEGSGRPYDMSVPYERCRELARTILDRGNPLKQADR